MALGDLSDLIRNHPDVAGVETVDACRQVLESPVFADETQAFFLYKRAAEALSQVITTTGRKEIGFQALESIEAILGTTKGHPHRASAEAIGSLPLEIACPDISTCNSEGYPRLEWGDVLRMSEGTADCRPRVLGRTLVIDIAPRDSVLAVKLALTKDAVASAVHEGLWMERLASMGSGLSVRFHVPKPIRVGGNHVFRLTGIPGRVFPLGAHPAPVHAIAFIAHGDYFSYPNDHRPGTQLCPEAFKEVVFRNAWLFGKLAAMGIVHTAPIPLFHNRVQRGRRPDQGLYEWERAGRLDRWLYSCRFPNFGKTGIRDFEHLIAFSGASRELYRRIGAHLLSLLLTIGSYFRHKDPVRIGLDETGNPIDARDLFDPVLLAELVEGVFGSYYEGFTGHGYNGTAPVDLEMLIPRMIDELGVDRHMEEILRVADQVEMSDQTFRRFLRQRGYTDEAVTLEKKGVRDIITYTGPHLGGFNEGISIPELIDAVGTLAALCIAGRYRSEVLARG
jgi:hypothetical protein